MIFEASFYLNRPVTPEVIMAFAETFGGRLNRMTITDARLRSRSWRPDPARIAQALDADFLPSQILLFQKGKDGNNNLPDYAMELTRLSSAEKSDTIYLLSAQVPAEDEEELAANWWKLAAEAGFRTGYGYLMQWPILEIGYGSFSSSAPDERTPTWLAHEASVRRFILERPGFLPVVEGKMLRNVLRQNFMTADLAETVKDGLKQSRLPTDGFAPCSQDRVVWTLLAPQAQRAAYDALYQKGLIWENDWFDLAGYRPTPPRSRVWPEAGA